MTPGLPEHLAAPAARVDHRVWIAGAIRTLLMVYSDFPTDPRVAAEMGRMWADDLEWFPRDVIEGAVNRHRRSETRKPTPAAIIALCREAMPKPRAVPQIEAHRQPVTKEQAAAILEANGYGDIVRRIPRD